MAIYEDAEFYDIEFSTRDREIPFFRKQAQASGGPILEVACGTGRITLPIASDGIEVSGLDVSAPMIERARMHAESAGLQVHWYIQDCRDIRIDSRFALVFSATNAMQHLLEIESVCAFLTSARRVLRPGGTLIIDVFHPNIAKLFRKANQRYVHKTITPPDGVPIMIEAASHYQSDTQILQFDLYYMRAGKHIRTKHVNMRCFFPEELRAICLHNGFKIKERFGNYDESSFHANSSKQILVLEAS